jgi:ribonuclease HI
VLTSSAPVNIYVEGAAPGAIKTKSAGAGIFFGLGSSSNASLKVPGPGRATSDRGCIYAICEAVRKVDSDTTLVIFCSSERVIRELRLSAAKNSALGWPGVNGDLTRLVHIDSKAKNEWKYSARSLAKAGLRVPASATEFQPRVNVIQECNLPHGVIDGVGRKVKTELCR